MDTSALFKKQRGKPITYQESHSELAAAYDEVMGFDTGRVHVGMSFEENPLRNSLLEIWAETYARDKVWDTYHIDFDAFLDRPRFEIMMMLKNVRRLEQLKTQSANTARNQMDAEAAQLEAGHARK